MKPLVLFDMDGTLTEPRQAAGNDIMYALEELSQHANIGIVSGSDYDYIQEQMPFGYWSHKRWANDMLIYPCNGTKRYIKGRLNHSVNMKEHLGNEQFYKLINVLIQLQSFYIVWAKEQGFDTPLTGTHFQNRGSTLNWCPIGRMADQDERKAFVDFDSQEEFREYTLFLIEESLKECRIEGVTVVKGGSTSFDIYPDGWDKTYVLRFHPDEVVYFVGDRCEKGGNDYELYKALQNRKVISDREQQLSLFSWRKNDKAQSVQDYHHGFKTKSPKETIEIINNSIIPHIKSRT